jgi:hypothetical protein
MQSDTASVRKFWSDGLIKEAKISNEAVALKRKQRNDIEQQLFDNFVVCNSNEAEKLQDLLYRIDVGKAAELVRTQLFNPAVIDLISCLSYSISYPGDLSPISMSHIRRWLSSGTIIGSGVDGVVANLDFKNNHLFYQKTAHRRETDELLHEAVIGFYCLNKLRKEGIPNFAYIYSGFKCPPPIIVNGKIISICRDSTEQVNYLLLESVVPSISSEKYMERATGFGLRSNFAQLCFTLHRAYQHCRYRHCDMHPGNVLLRYGHLGPRFQIPYKHQGELWYVQSEHVATVIDYGRNYAEVEGQILDWPSNFDPRVPFDEEPLQLQDIYVWLMNCMYLRLYHVRKRFTRPITETDDEVLQAGYQISKFFNTSASFSAWITDIDEQYNSWYALPRTPGNIKASMADLIEYIMSLESFRDVLSPVKFRVPELKCQNDCLTRAEALSMIQSNETWDLYDFYSYLVKHPRISPTEYSKHYPKSAIIRWNERIQEQINNLDFILDRTVIADMNVPPERLIEPKLFTLYKGMIGNALILNNEIQLIYDEISILEAVTNRSNNIEIISQARRTIKRFENEVEERIPRVRQLIEYVLSNWAKVESLISKRSVVNKNSEANYKWYNEEGRRGIEALRYVMYQTGLYAS